MSADFLPTASLEMLHRRAELLGKVRRFFEQRGFLEVETPLLSHDVVVDRHLHPLSARLFADPSAPEQGQRIWLQTSPEFAMKRLLAAGATAIFQITKSFRACERGRLHNPEFTIVEWYRIGDGYEEGMQLLDELAAETLGRGHSQRLTYREAFNLYAGIDPFTTPLAELVAKLQALMDFSLSKEVQSRDLVLDLLLTQLVEPHLGREQPTILHDYPPSQAALAQVRSENPPVAERFELYVNGMELANGYHELLDAAELRKRLQRQNELRSAEGHYTLPEGSRLLAAMDLGLPACSGCALGFDRLVMAATNAKSIQDVIAFPIDRA